MVSEIRRPIQSSSGAMSSPSGATKDFLIQDQNSLSWLSVSKTTSLETKSEFGSVPNLDKINNIKFYYVRRTIKINWKEQLKEVPKFVWGDTMKASQRREKTKTNGCDLKDFHGYRKRSIRKDFQASFSIKTWPEKWMDHGQSKW